jgi:hypothetical protein
MSLAARDTATSYILSRGESIGLALDTEAGILSAIAASFILVLISVRHKKNSVDAFHLKPDASTGSDMPPQRPGY